MTLMACRESPKTVKVPDAPNPPEETRLTYNGAPLEVRQTVKPGDFVRLAVSGARPEQRVVLRDSTGGVVWFDGPAAELNLGFHALRTPELKFTADFSPADDPAKARQEFTLTLDRSRPALYPGLLVQVLRRDGDSSVLPEPGTFAPPAGTHFPQQLDADYRDYPPFRTAESVMTQPFDAVSKPRWTPPGYFHGIIPTLAIQHDRKRIIETGAPPQYPLDDLGPKAQSAALFSGELLIDRAGEHEFRLECNLPSRLEIGGKTTASTGNLVVALKAGTVPLRLTVAKSKELPQLECRLLWKRPGDASAVPVPPSVLVHRVDPLREKALAAVTQGMPYRQATVTRSKDDNAAVQALKLPPAQVPVDSSANFTKSINPIVQAYLQGKTLGGDAAAARAAFALIRARLDFLRSHPEQIAPGMFTKTDGNMMRLFEALRPLLSLCERDPRLQQEALAARAELAAFAVGTCLSRSFFNEVHWGTNDGYGDDGNLLVNFWRAAACLDDPYAWDAATCLMDSHFRYSAGCGEGLSSDGIFDFHNVNGRHVHMNGYGYDWYKRLAFGQRSGTPWGYTPEQYRRLSAYLLAFEQVCYQGTSSFAANGRHNTHSGDAAMVATMAGRLTALPVQAIRDEDRAAMLALQQRIKANPGNSVSGNTFFFRNLLTVHRRPDFYIDVKMISPLAGPPETFAGAYPWNMSFGNGVTTLMRDGKEYAGLHRNAPNAVFSQVRSWKGDDYTATDLSLWQYACLPGTTQLDDEQKTADRYRTGRGETAGGVSDGTLGHCAFHYLNSNTGADVRKLFAFTDDGMAVLATGIAATRNKGVPDGVTMRSNLNQCDWRGDVTVLSQDGKQVSLPHNGKDGNFRLPLTQRYWINHDGIGYLVVPTGAECGPGKPGTLCLDLTTRSPLCPMPGFPLQEKTAAAIRAKKLDSSRTIKIFHLSIDHGRDVKDASCAYFVCMSGGNGKSMLQAPPIEVLANTPAVQALCDRRDHTVHAFFREPGELAVAGQRLLQVERPASVMWRPATRTVTVQDPVAACSRDAKQMADALTIVLDRGLQGVPGEVRTSVTLPGSGDSDDRYRGRPVTRRID